MLSYFYGGRLPSHAAAPIQIALTCGALAELGVDVSLHTGPLCGSVDDALTALGLPGARRPLCVVPHAHPASMGLALVRERARGGLVIARGRPLLRLLWLLGPAAPRFVLECHRLDFTDDPPTLGAVLGGAPPPLLRPRLRLARERALVRRAAGVVCLTQGFADVCGRLFRGDAAATPLVLPSGARASDDDENNDGRDVEIRDRDIDILYAGKVLARKGVPDLVGALAHLPGRRLVVLGDARTGRARALLRRWTRDAGVDDDRVEAVGYVAPREMGSWWRRARVGVCPLPLGTSLVAERFTSPLKVLEMMAAGTPIVATDVPALRELLVDDETALLARPNDAASLALRIRALLDDQARATRLAERARAQADGLTWASRARRLADWLSTLS